MNTYKIYKLENQVKGLIKAKIDLEQRIYQKFKEEIETLKDQVRHKTQCIKTLEQENKYITKHKAEYVKALKDQVRHNDFLQTQINLQPNPKYEDEGQ